MRCRHAFHGRQDRVDAGTGERGRGQHRHALERRHLHRHLLEIDFGALGLKVPFVDDRDQAASFAPRQRRQLLILHGQALDGVDHQHRHVGAAERRDGAADGGALERILHATAAADAGSVDQDVTGAGDLEQRVERVAGRAGGRVDERARKSEHTVHERRLPGVRSTDDGDADRVVARPGAGLRRELQDALHERRDAVAVGGRDWDQLVDAEAVELVAVGEARRRVELVDGEEHAGAAAAQLDGGCLVGGREPGLAVEQVDHESRPLEGGEAGVADGPLEPTAGRLAFEAPGVDQQHGAVVEDGDRLVDVAGHARGRVDDGFAAAKQPVEERRLARVRAAGDDDARQRPRGGAAGGDLARLWGADATLASWSSRCGRASARAGRRGCGGARSVSGCDRSATHPWPRWSLGTGFGAVRLGGARSAPPPRFRAHRVPVGFCSIPARP